MDKQVSSSCITTAEFKHTRLYNVLMTRLNANCVKMMVLDIDTIEYRLAEFEFDYIFSKEKGLMELDHYPDGVDVEVDRNNDLNTSTEIKYVRFHLTHCDEEYYRLCFIFLRIVDSDDEDEYDMEGVYEDASEFYPSSEEAIKLLSLQRNHLFSLYLIDLDLKVGQMKTDLMEIFYDFQEQCEKTEIIRRRLLM